MVSQDALFVMLVKEDGQSPFWGRRGASWHSAWEVGLQLHSCPDDYRGLGFL